MHTATRVLRKLAMVIVAAAGCLGLSGATVTIQFPSRPFRRARLTNGYWATGSPGPVPKT